MTVLSDRGGVPSRTDTDERVERLSAASLRRVIEPEIDLNGSVGPGMVIPRELLSVADLDLDLTDADWVRLSREELASILDAGVRFESYLMAGFGLYIARRPQLVDAKVRYSLHEVGEETRHSRLFVRVIEQLQPTAANPFTGRFFQIMDRLIGTPLLNWTALFCVLVLTGEEAPDRIQKRSSEHPDTDPFVRAVNKYHRLEEARHLSFARVLLPEEWARASRLQRWFVRRIAPYMMEGTIDSLVHPGVYATVGLSGWQTWKAVRSSPSRRRLKADSMRPILAQLLELGAFRRVPGAWRRACAVDAQGRPLS
jgi:hypothetical protein